MSAEHELNEIIKKLAVNVINESKPTDLCFGSVESVEPLKIRVNQKLLLTKEFLILSENVRKYNTIIDKNKVEIDNSLKKGEQIAMLRLNGGQIFYVLGRVIK